MNSGDFPIKSAGFPYLLRGKSPVWGQKTHPATPPQGRHENLGPTCQPRPPESPDSKPAWRCAFFGKPGPSFVSGAKQSLKMWGWINTYENTIFRGMNIHKSQLFWCELQGYKVLTHCHIEKETTSKLMMNNFSVLLLAKRLWPSS